MAVYVCCNEQRRDAVRKQHVLNGIDYIDVTNIHEPTTRHQRQTPQQSILHIYFINPLPKDALTKKNIAIERDMGGGDMRALAIVEIEIDHNVLRAVVKNPGDDATYTFKLFPDQSRLKLDTLLSTIEFTFQSSPDADYGAEQQSGVPEQGQEPEIDYMAKDFYSFRQLMLDRLTTLMPQWTERSPADLGVTLVELLAYVADSLSYQQDVIATESYLGTARRRISVRRHARLLDYAMHDGHNARTWVQVQVDEDLVRPDDAESTIPAILTKGTQLLTRVPALANGIVLLSFQSSVYNQAMHAQPTIFEVMDDVNRLYQAHNELDFYTWGAREYCLPKGATAATLAGAFPNLRVGDVLIFKEIRGALSGIADDAEPTHRCAVRLTKITVTTDPLGKLFQTSDDDSSVAPEQESAPTQPPQEEREVTIIEVEEKREERKGRKGREEEDITEAKITMIEGSGKDIFEDEQPTEKLPVFKPKQFMQLGSSDEKQNEPAKQEPVKSRGSKKGRSAQEETNEDDDDTIEQITIEDDDISERITVQLDEFKEKKGVREERRIVEEDSVQEKDGYIEERRVIEEKDIKKKGRKVEEEDIIIQEVTRVKEPDYALAVTEIEWSFEDALPFPVCISTTTDYEHGHLYLPRVSVAAGNIILADHGSIQTQLLPPVPAAKLTFAGGLGRDTSVDDEQSKSMIPPRFYPMLSNGPLTQVAPVHLNTSSASASAIIKPSAKDALPVVTLSNAGAETWTPQRDLLECMPADRSFVVECEANGTAYLRFGDGKHGMRPVAGTEITASYRVGNGIAGNIGADSLAYMVIEADSATSSEHIIDISNPLPAQGGCEPESIDSVRLHLPGVFHTQERGVTPDDFKMLAERHPEVQRANIYTRWTGSWFTIFVVVERIGGTPIDDVFLRRVRQYLERYRMAGGDIELVKPIYVPLEITMNIRVKSGYLRTTVKESLQELFSTRRWSDGRRGIFSPGEAQGFSFGKTVYLNPLYATASAVSGVESVTITRFERQGISSNEGIATRELMLSWQELARLENDVRHPEHGIVHVNTEG